MISSIKQSLLRNLKNIPGWSINKKIVVIECDDWGSIRMPSKQVYEKLLSAGIPVDSERFTRYDTLANKDDLESLFEVLISVKDQLGKPAVMTPFSNIANPDFEKIRDSGFNEYHYEPFTTTLERYNRHPDTFKLWQEGIIEGIFVPEFHGREHLAVQLWMQKLQEGDKKLRLAFDLGYTSVDVAGIPEVAKQFRQEFYYTKEEHKEFLKRSIKEGVELFELLFGYRPIAFVPANGIFNPDLETSLSDSGIKFLQTGYWEPIYYTNGKVGHHMNVFGQKSKNGLRYYIRNGAFEPTDDHYKGIGMTISQIEAAFRWHKPAIIVTHRVNYVGGIEKSNRIQGLKELKLLLDTIVKKWPGVEFMSSAEMFNSFPQFTKNG